jgi:hypothetical protein
VDDKAVEEREWFRAEWERLNRQREELLAETIQLQASQDVLALRAHAERLALHKEELAVFRELLDGYRARYRPGFVKDEDIG